MKAQNALHLFQDLDKKTPKSTGRMYHIFEKYDGWYGYMDEDCVIHSRAGRPIPSLVELGKSIKTRLGNSGGRLIFEILLRQEKEFTILNGILNRKKEQAVGAYLRVHDYIEKDAEGNYLVDKPFNERYEDAKFLVTFINHPDLELAPILHTDNTVDSWKGAAESVWTLGGEGVILKAIDGVFSPDKRNADLLKIKEELTLDLLVTGIERGEGKYLDTTGTIVVEGKDGIKHHISGMTDKQRESWWTDPDSIIGQVVEVKAMKKLKDGSLREPRFKAIRHDKEAKDID